MADTLFIDNSTLIVASWLNDINDHKYNPTLTAHGADQISFTPTGGITSTNVQDAIAEVEAAGSVSSVNGETGVVVLTSADFPDIYSKTEVDNAIIANAVSSVNTKTGVVTLTSADFPDMYSKTEVDNAIAAVSSAVVKIASGTVTNAASLDITNLSSTYFKYVIVLNGVRAYSSADESFALRFSQDNGSTFIGESESGPNTYIWRGPVNYDTSSDYYFYLMEAPGSLDLSWPDYAASMEITIFDPMSSEKTKLSLLGYTDHDTSGSSGPPDDSRYIVGGVAHVAGPTNALRLYFLTDNIGTLDYVVYGYKA